MKLTEKLCFSGLLKVDTMKIASFNIRRMGPSKLSNKNIVNYLIKVSLLSDCLRKSHSKSSQQDIKIDHNTLSPQIFSRYSIIVLLEVVDKSGKAIDKFLQELNSTGSVWTLQRFSSPSVAQKPKLSPNLTHFFSHRANKKRPFTMVGSSRLGRTLYKEQFVCFYRYNI